MNDDLYRRAQALKLHGLCQHWQEVTQSPWVSTLLGWEEQARTERSLARRLSAARIGAFKPLCDFDWSWPTQCDRELLEELMTLNFLKKHENVVFMGSNGVGKTTLAKNIAHQAILQGYTVLMTTAGQLLGELSALDSDSALRRRLRFYASPDLLCIDEVGYLSYNTRMGDLLFQLINQRYESKSTLFTTNRPFAEWSEVFSSSGCVVSMVDRILHRAEIVHLEGQSYRAKEAAEHATQRRKKPKIKPNP